MKKSHNPKKKRKIFSLKNIIVTIIVVFVILFILAVIGGNQIEQTAEESYDDVPLEEVREQASDAFLTNDESVDAADIEVGLG